MIQCSTQEPRSYRDLLCFYMDSPPTTNDKFRHDQTITFAVSGCFLFHPHSPRPKNWRSTLRGEKGEQHRTEATWQRSMELETRTINMNDWDIQLSIAFWAIVRILCWRIVCQERRRRTRTGCCRAPISIFPEAEYYGDGWWDAMMKSSRTFTCLI